MHGIAVRMLRSHRPPVGRAGDPPPGSQPMASSRSPGPSDIRPASGRFPAPVVLILNNGLSVYLHDLPGLDSAGIACHVGADARSERADLSGVTGAMAAAMCTGTRLLSAEQFAAASRT